MIVLDAYAVLALLKGEPATGRSGRSSIELCRRVLLEPMDATVEDALCTVEAIEAEFDRAAPAPTRLLHGFERTSGPIFDAAEIREYDTRMGIEDTVRLPYGAVARGNAQLVCVAAERLAVAPPSDHPTL